jgi:hypothetical protein
VRPGESVDNRVVDRDVVMSLGLDREPASSREVAVLNIVALT